MAILRYISKKSGTVHLFETIPGEFTSSGAPKKRYLGIEIPDGELKSSGASPKTRKRKTGSAPSKKKKSTDEERLAALIEENRKLKNEISELKKVQQSQQAFFTSFKQLLGAFRS